MRGVFGIQRTKRGKSLAYGIHWGREWGKVGDFCRKVLYFCRKTDNFLPLMDNLRRIGVTSVYQEEQVQVTPVNNSPTACSKNMLLS